ncbi:hypothetical protein ALC53_09337 [Atta colombica]|uniref:Uncharacterized protein n=1 Tax=Atta colombica TaxID=520822 RepID=A0A195B6V0_9HYME|nr:hypothetical protein ALC53_09337 [Atta colombica]
MLPLRSHRGHIESLFGATRIDVTYAIWGEWLGKTTAYNVDNLPFALTFAAANAPAFYVHHFVVIPYAFITRPSRSDPFQIM